MIIGKLLCLLGFHQWHENDPVKGYGRQTIRYKGCKRAGCYATKIKEEGDDKWRNKTLDKWREILECEVMNTKY